MAAVLNFRIIPNALLTGNCPPRFLHKKALSELAEAGFTATPKTLLKQKPKTKRVLILLLNAVAILNEERFLARIGWARNSAELYGDTESVKAKLINLISAVRTLMRIPLIAVNVVVIVYALVLG
ncbi:Yos1-like-domain-containing protein [Kickxella alabastrina]|uniref:Yos1-like-domain-containing protein n=1 Tax=Kickxella alabastrina TaxID=61397 RepID=UPI00221F8BDE|nr:Yos1-like-domain-containing protein [Kickxella alabastrina]KAI7833495.1 Yos1-like-domain-containing protein [Kickxella alabastrina]